MRKWVGLVLALMFLMAGCSNANVATDYPAAIMVDGQIYYLSSTTISTEIGESAVIGYTEFYTDTFPAKDNETNFNRELQMPIATVEDGIAVFYDDAWHLCWPK
jgi:hypothetical protein